MKYKILKTEKIDNMTICHYIKGTYGNIRIFDDIAEAKNWIIFEKTISTHPALYKIHKTRG